MNLKSIFEQILSGVVTAIVLSVAVLIWNALSNGSVIHLLGGVTKVEYTEGLQTRPSPASVAVAQKSAWARVIGDERFDPKCDYRWTITDDMLPLSQFNFDSPAPYAFYPSFVSTKQLSLSENGYAFAVFSNKKGETSIIGPGAPTHNPVSFVESRCP